MDEADADREVVAATGGVTVRKRFEEAEFHQPAVVYEFASDRDEERTVRLIETIPEAVAPENLGFLGSTMERTWQIKGPKLVFENPLGPKESFTTAVAARGEHASAVTDLLGQPDIFEVVPDGEAEGPGAADENGTTATDRDSVVERFVAELRAGEVAEERLAALRAELGVARTPTSVEVRLDQLQADVADVRGYSNALAAFLDEHGRADDVVDRLERRLDDLETTVEDVEETVSATDGDVERIEALVDDLGTDVAALASDLDDLDDRLDGFEADIDRLAERVPDEDVETRLDALERDLEEVSAFTDSLRSAFER